MSWATWLRRYSTVSPFAPDAALTAFTSAMRTKPIYGGPSSPILLYVFAYMINQTLISLARPVLAGGYFEIPLIIESTLLNFPCSLDETFAAIENIYRLGRRFVYLPSSQQVMDPPIHNGGAIVGNADSRVDSYYTSSKDTYAFDISVDAKAAFDLRK